MDSVLNVNRLVAPGVGEEEFDNQITDQYGRANFWDERYMSQNESFDWYYSYEYFREIIRHYLDLESKVMVAGCGNSDMLEHMARDGYRNILGVDLSRVVIEQMKVRCRQYEAISFFQGNMTDTNLPEKSFRAVIDKALFDSLLCSSAGVKTVHQYIYEVVRLLDDEGVFILISYGKPEDRLIYLEQFDAYEPNYTPWIVNVHAIPKPRLTQSERVDMRDPDLMYYIYVCEIQAQMVTLLKDNEQRRAKRKAKEKKKVLERIKVGAEPR